MAKVSKRTKEFEKIVDKTQAYNLQDAVAKIEEFPKVKFDETIEFHANLNVDVKSSDQLVRGTVALPHGTGRKVRILVFCKGELTKKAEDAGADYVGAAELVEKVTQGFMDFDCVIATPDMMRDISKLGKVLGPRGLMPSPKAGTVTNDVAKAIQEIRSGRVEFKTDKQGGVHLGVGKRSFSSQQMFDNVSAVLNALNHVKPASVKGTLIKSLWLSTTMGPGVKVAI
ncbi:MAG: 50S ribosomal protein L1 [Candidatus Omnitrophica bacterium]|nr:50S ribosomal protein L1 [Candidatus Omnitrophota bacterium]